MYIVDEIRRMDENTLLGMTITAMAERALSLMAKK